MDSEKDKKVKRIARFLELGGTMLAEHCKVCGAPKFRYQGTVICPVCDVRDEEETPEPEVQVPEARQYAEEKRSSFKDEKGVQAHRQKLQAGQKTSETAKEDKGGPGFEDEFSEISYEAGKPERYPSAVQAVSSGRAEKPEEVLKPYGTHEDRKALENLLFKKVVSIASSLQNETDPRSIAEGFGLIDKGLELIERLRHV